MATFGATAVTLADGSFPGSEDFYFVGAFFPGGTITAFEAYIEDRAGNAAFNNFDYALYAGGSSAGPAGAALVWSSKHYSGVGVGDPGWKSIVDASDAPPNVSVPAGWLWFVLRSADGVQQYCCSGADRGDLAEFGNTHSYSGTGDAPGSAWPATFEANGAPYFFCMAVRVEYTAGAAIVDGDGSAAGTANVVAVGAAVAAATGEAAGTATASAVGAAAGDAAGTAAGVATAAATGAAIAAGAGSAAGTSTAAAVSAASGDAAGAASGTSAAAAVGSSVASAVGSAAGTSTAIGVSDSAASVGTATGSSTVSAVGAPIASAVGSAAGSSTATGSSVTFGDGIGAAAGVAAVTATGVALYLIRGSASGSSTASAVGRSLAESAGLAAGLAVVDGSSVTKRSRTVRARMPLSDRVRYAAVGTTDRVRYPRFGR